MISALREGQLRILCDLITEPDAPRTHDTPFHVEQNVRAELDTFRLMDLVLFKPAPTDTVFVGIVLKLALTRLITDGKRKAEL